MRRRTLLLGAVAAASAALAGCTVPEPDPVPSGSPAPSASGGSPTPTPSASGAPEPAAFARSRWSTDPYALGSGSASSPGTVADREVLAEPIADRIFFAGEAMSIDRAGTVAGAWISGLRVAEDVARRAGADDRIAILGAGAAGAAAAQQLRAAGFEVVVLEARDRVGGRILTVRNDDWPLPVELGALLLPDPVGSPMIGELTALEVETRLLDAEPEVRTTDGIVVEDPAVSAARDTAPRIVLGGFDALVDNALADVDVRLSNAVAGVSLTDEGVALILVDGESFSADRVVVTVPLGVLQSESVVFDPPLPANRLAALQALGTEYRESVVLRFEERFWDTEAVEWTVVDGDGDGDGMIDTWYNLEPLTGELVLVGRLSAEAAEESAALDDADLRTAALRSLLPFVRS